MYRSSGKEKYTRCLVFMFPTKHVAVLHGRQRLNVQKSLMHVRSCCFTNLNLLLLFAVLVDVAVAVA